MAPKSDGRRAEATSSLTLKISPSVVMLGGRATISWEAPGACGVRIELDPVPQGFVDRGWTRNTCGMLELTDLQASEYRVTLRADFADDTDRMTQQRFAPVNRAVYYGVRALGLATLALAVLTVAFVVVLTDQTEKIGIGALVRTVSWLTGALGAIAALPILVNALTGGESPFSTLANLLPSRPGWPFSTYVLLCSCTILGCVTLLATTDNELILNRTDRDVYVIEGGKVVYVFPKGMSAIRPRRETTRLMSDSASAPYVPQDVKSALDKNHTRTLRCYDRVVLTSVPLDQVSLTIDEKAFVPLSTEAAEGPCGNECNYVGCTPLACKRFTFELEYKDCENGPLRIAQKIGISASHGELSLTALLPRGQSRSRDALGTALNIELRSMNVLFREVLEFSAMNANVTIKGKCGNKHCSYLTTNLTGVDEPLDWSFPSSDQKWDQSGYVGVDGWRLLFNRPISDFFNCEEGPILLSEHFPHCPFKVIHGEVDASFNGWTTVQLIDSSTRWSFGRLVRAEALDLHVLGSTYEVKLWSDKDRTAPDVSISTKQTTDSVTVVPPPKKPGKHHDLAQPHPGSPATPPT